MTEGRGYADPSAFRRALTDRLKAPQPRADGRSSSSSARSPTTGCWSGCISSTTAGWSRERPPCSPRFGMRATIDVDVYRAAASETAEADLRQATGRDIGDWFDSRSGQHGSSAKSRLGATSRCGLCRCHGMGRVPCRPRRGRYAHDWCAGGGASMARLVIPDVDNTAIWHTRSATTSRTRLLPRSNSTVLDCSRRLATRTSSTLSPSS